MLSKQNKQIIIGLIALALSLSSVGFRGHYDTTMVRTSQITATIILLFGLLKAHPAHKATFLLFWLGFTFVLLYYLIFAFADYLDRFSFGFYSLYRYLGMFQCVSVIATVVFLMNLIYKDYVELTVGHPNSVPEAKKPPPAYDPSLHNLAVSVES